MKTMRLKFIFSIFLFSVSANSAVQFNTDLVRPWKKDGKRQFPAPLVAIFKKDGKVLVFVGDSHSDQI